MWYDTVSLQVDYAKAGAQGPEFGATMQTYLLSPSDEMPYNAVRPAVLICPGGAYRFRSDREAEPIAMRFLAAGYHAIVVNYSVAPQQYPCAALELAAAVRATRRNAKEWGVDPNAIYICGFSAGGHLCATLGALWDEPLFHDVLGSEPDWKPDWKPDGMILCYPVITMGPYTHEESRDLLTGGRPELIDELSLEKRVSKKTVPAFIWHTFADTAVPLENTLQLVCAMRKAGVPFELHVYENGVHGLSLCSAVTGGTPELIVPDNQGWMDLALRWLERRSGRCPETPAGD